MNALRFNTGKVRLDLLPDNAMVEVAKVFTYGAHKYSIFRDSDGKEFTGEEVTPEQVASEKMEKIYDGADNWRNGLEWKGVAASCKRHISKFMMGQDFDEESGLYHISHAIANLLFIQEYYKIAPQKDNRFQNIPKIGLDIDDVLADWAGTFSKKFGFKQPEVWKFTYGLGDIIEKFGIENYSRFISELPVKTSPNDIPFEPHCYITSRMTTKDISEKWLEENGFPCAPVYSIGHGESKVDIAKESGIDVFVDDSYSNFTDLQKAGIACYLFDAPHNQRYNVGHWRIKELKDLPWFKNVFEG